MLLLQPNWTQEKPTPWQAHEACRRVAIDQQPIEADAIHRVLERLRETHGNGGAYFASFRIGEDAIFDWFASRNRLLEYEVLPQLLRRDEIRAALPELQIPEQGTGVVQENACSLSSSHGFSMDNAFLLEGQLASALFSGGAYGAQKKIDGKTAMSLAAAFVEAVFQRRYEEIRLYSSHQPRTPWFGAIAWDWTAVFFDLANHTLSLLAVTDED